MCQDRVDVLHCVLGVTTAAYRVMPMGILITVPIVVVVSKRVSSHQKCRFQLLDSEFKVSLVLNQ